MKPHQFKNRYISEIGIISGNEKRSGVTMEFEDAFQVADRAVFAKTGKHLSDLQKILLEGACNGDT